MITGEISFQIWAQNNTEYFFRQKWLVKKKFVWRKKNPPRAQIFRYFRIESHPPTRHLKYKSIDFAPYNKPIKANKLLLTSLERFLGRILTLRLRVNSAKYIAR